jgi:hypothetical protein
MIKRVCLENQEPELVLDALFWSAEQNRWIDMLTNLIKEKDPIKDREWFTWYIRVEMDVCLPANISPQFKSFKNANDAIRWYTKITIPASWWEKLWIGWKLWIEQIGDMVFERCELEHTCPDPNVTACGYGNINEIRPFQAGFYCFCKVEKRKKSEKGV